MRRILTNDPRSVGHDADVGATVELIVNGETLTLLKFGPLSTDWCVSTATGPRGLVGSIGLMGQMGPPGIDGEDGEPGDRGAIGPPGPIGAQGPAGQPGLDGEDGQDGLPGSPGPQGPIGATGLTGAQGLQGLPGLDGEDGGIGEQGLPGFQGPPGLTGSSGPQGPIGANGPPGPPGQDADDPEMPYVIPGPSGSIGPSAVTKIAGNSGAAGPDVTYQILTVDAASNSTTTYVTVMTTIGLSASWYKFKYLIASRSSAATTGQKYRVNFTGTQDKYVAIWHWGSTGTAQTTSTMAAGSDATGLRIVQFNIAQVPTSDLGPTTAVQTAGADDFSTIEGFIHATAAGDLKLDHASEVAAASLVLAGTWLELVKIV